MRGPVSCLCRSPVVRGTDSSALARQLTLPLLLLPVIDPEPPATDHPIYSLRNVVVTPHRGSATVKTRRAMSQLCIDNLLAGLAGKDLLAQAN